MNKEYMFSISPYAFWIKGKIIFEKNKIIIKTKDMFFGIPSGNIEETIPARKISSLKIVKTLNAHVVGVELLMCILFVLLIKYKNNLDINSEALIVLTGVIVVCLMFYIPKTLLIISKIGGKVILNVPFYERKTLEKIQEEIERRYIR